VSGSDSFSISVEGELSRKELADVRKVVKALQRAAAKGDAERLLHRLSRPDLDTIASVAGSVRSETVVSAAVAAGSRGEAGQRPPAEDGDRHAADHAQAEERLRCFACRAAAGV
jgi:hypothetical protein